MRDLTSNGPRNRCADTSLRRQGGILPLAAVMLIAFLAAAALAIDMAYVQLAETELRSCLDGTARAGAQAISRGLSDAEVRAEMKLVAAQNSVGGEGLTLEDEDIVLGHAAVQADGGFVFSAGSQPVNAVRILGRRSHDSASGSITSLLGGMFGQSSYDIQRVSAATIQDRDLVVIADRSSSMQNKDGGAVVVGNGNSTQTKQITRLEALKLAAIVFRLVLESTDAKENVGLAAYDDDARTLVPLSTDFTQFDQAILSLDTGSGTNIGLGIDEGLKVLQAARPTASRVMILMTDGRHNSWRDPEAAAADAMAAMPHLTIYTITFSDSADQQRMQRVAAIGRGEHHHAQDYKQLATVFEHLARTAGSVLIE